VITLEKKFDIYLKVGQKIKEYREEQSLTQVELAEKINISLSYLSKIEAANCKKSFSLDVLQEIANALNKDIKDFF